MNKTKSGFTIVELLIVIIVVAVLVALTIVSFGTITTRAQASLVETKISTYRKALDNFYTINSRFPGAWEMRGTTGAELIGLKVSDVAMPDQGRPYAGIDCWSTTDVNQKGFCYNTAPNPDGTGFMCDPPTICRFYQLQYVDRRTKSIITIRYGR